MKRFLLVLLGCLVVVALCDTVAHAATTQYQLPKHAKTCKRGYRKTVEHKKKHGKKMRVIECVKVATTKTIVPAPKTTAPTSTAIPQSPPTITPTVTPTTVRATIDPDWTLAVTTPQTPPVPVTFTYSASSGNDPLPDGEITLSIFVHASVSSAGGCETNVGGAVTSATCTVNLPAFGSYDLVTSYSSGVGDVAATGDTETVDIEPPEPVAQNIIEAWGTTPPTNNATINALVIGANATITLTDLNFEGVTSVGLTDQLGDTCTATVTNTTATCTMAVTSVPTSFVIYYGGAPTNTSSQTVTDWGIPQSQEVDYQWPAQTVTVSNPTVTVQQAITEWNGGRVDNGGQFPQSWTNAPPAIISMTVGETLDIGAYAAGSLATNPFPLGGIDFTMTPTGDYTMTDNQPASSSVNCADSFNYSLQAVGECHIQFSGPGTYELTPSYLSSDEAYANSTGTTVQINVTN